MTAAEARALLRRIPRPGSPLPYDIAADMGEAVRGYLTALNLLRSFSPALADEVEAGDALSGKVVAWSAAPSGLRAAGYNLSSEYDPAIPVGPGEEG